MDPYCNVRNRTNCERLLYRSRWQQGQLRRSKMSYQTDRRSRTRAIAVYVTLLMIGAALGFLVRFGVITDHILW